VNPDLLAQLTVNGLLSGAFYALVGLSWGLIFSTTRIFHFSHALTFAVAGYGFTVAATAGLPLPAAAAAAGLVGGAAGLAEERWLYRPLRRASAPQLNIFLASLGFLFAGQSLLQIIFGPSARRVPGFTEAGISLGPVAFTNLDAAMAGGSVVLAVLTLGFLYHSRPGRAIRGVASNPELARAVGISDDAVYSLVFALGSLLVGLASVPYVLKNAATPTMGVAPVLAGFIGVFLGGVGNYGGMLVGGLILGLAENLGGLVLPGYWQAVIAFVILFVLVLVRPAGLFGQPAR
jgi:branched-chain amino acid transport system permease protein